MNKKCAGKVKMALVRVATLIDIAELGQEVARITNMFCTRVVLNC
jgi:hypothetical protein